MVRPVFMLLSNGQANPGYTFRSYGERPGGMERKAGKGKGGKKARRYAEREVWRKGRGMENKSV